MSRLRTPLRDGGHGSSGFSGWLQQAMHGAEEIFGREGFAEKRVRQLLDLRDIRAVGFTPGYSTLQLAGHDGRVARAALCVNLKNRPLSFPFPSKVLMFFS